jgi:hypothetical protein
MCTIVLRYHSEKVSGHCAVCSQPVLVGCGLQLVQADAGHPICSACVRETEPALGALAQLAAVAGRVGVIGQYTVSPPLNALLELARAAENYADRLDSPQAPAHPRRKRPPLAKAAAA